MKTKFGNLFGGQYVPETLMQTLLDLEKDFLKFSKDKAFLTELKYYLKQYSGRPTPLYFAENVTKNLKGAKVYIKREDLNHTGSHKINNVIGQCLLAKKIGKKRVIAETGAGQHGVATATAAALFNLKCTVFMGAEDVERQSLNVYKMKLLGAEVIPVQSSTQTLKDATNAAMRDWVKTVESTFYVLGSVVGPHPYPKLVRFFQKIIGEETKKQLKTIEKRTPDYLIACVGGGSNSMGFFYPFIKNKNVKLIGVEAGGIGLNSNEHCATLSKGTIGVLHGMKTYLLQDKYGQISKVHSISAGLDYPGVGSEHSYLHHIKRAEYVSITDKEALNAVKYLTIHEGIIPALESAHAVAYAIKLVPKLDKNKIVVINLSGRGDKDMETIRNYIK